MPSQHAGVSCRSIRDHTEPISGGATVSSRGSVCQRCGCRIAGNGMQLSPACSLLTDPGHGSWYFAIDLPKAPDGRGRHRAHCRHLRQRRTRPRPPRSRSHRPTHPRRRTAHNPRISPTAKRVSNAQPPQARNRPMRLSRTGFRPRTLDCRQADGTDPTGSKARIGGQIPVRYGSLHARLPVAGDCAVPGHLDSPGAQISSPMLVSA
jgi:hypothetical protein